MAREMRPIADPLGRPVTGVQVMPPFVDSKTPLPAAPLALPTAAKSTAVLPVVVGSMTTSDQGSVLSWPSAIVTFVQLAPPLIVLKIPVAACLLPLMALLATAA